jgi:GntR family transcriptional regulator, transcriptional repressor for pyruvate dehydrogenase complex
METPGDFFYRKPLKRASIEWVSHLIIHRMSTKSSPQAPGRPQVPPLKRRERTPDHRAAGSPAPLRFRPIHTRRAFEEICERIREQLVLGVLRPGDKLPPERDLAQQLGVSRNVLREALRSLEMAGVLRLQKGVKGGAFVQKGDTGRMNDVMRDMLSLGTISVRELSEARIHVLELVVRLACANARQNDFAALEANIERTDLATREGRLLDRVECSREFYKSLAAATGNKVIAMILDSVTEIHMRFVYAKVASSGVAMPRLAERRRQFVSALRERNVALASRLMRSHLEAVQRMLERDPGAMSLQVALAEMQPGMRR